MSKILVLTYQFTANPDQLPADWPALVSEVADDTPIPTDHLCFATAAEYESYRALHQADYDTVMAAKALVSNRALVWEQIKVYRDQRLNGGVYCNGHWFHTDIKSITQHSGLKDQARDMLAAGGSMSDILSRNIPGYGVVQINWKTMSGEEIPMTCQLAYDLVDADGLSQIIQFGVGKQHKAALDVSPNPLLYNYKVGWPPIYGE